MGILAARQGAKEKALRINTGGDRIGSADGKREPGRPDLEKAAGMKRWAVAVVLGYFLLLEVLLALGRRVHVVSGGTYLTTLVADVPFDTVARLLGLVSAERWAWACVGPPVLCLVVFLRVPLALAEQRTVSWQVRLGSALASGCLVALLAFSGGLAAGEVFGLGASHAWGAAWLAFPVLT